MKLHSTVIGSGPKSLALIHGVTGDQGTWFELAPRLAEFGYTVTLVDLRGHGLSPRADSYGMDDFAADVVDTLPVGMDVVIGHSLGGRTLSGAVDSLRPAKAVYFDPAWQVSNLSDTDGFFPQHDDGTPMSPDEFQPFVPRWSRDHVIQAIASNQRFDPAIMPGGAIPDLGDYTPPVPPVVPSLVVLADQTELVPPAMQDYLRAGGYEVRTVTGAGHNFHIEDLEATIAALDGWI
jgi:pimeloyl-ACP methyl ester carboxylesterase